MKKFIALLMALSTLFLFSACQMRPIEIEQLKDGYQKFVENLGHSQLTASQDLIGKRTSTADEYTGSYEASCTRSTSGRDVIFGGASLKSREVHVRGTLQREAGKATVRIRMNGKVEELPIDQSGSFEVDCHMESGGNYIMVVYDSFQGSVQLVSEYEEKEE